MTTRKDNNLKVVVVTSEKGGTGKTTLSTHIAALLAAAHGKRVLLVDFDPQGHVAVSFGMAESPGLYDVMVRKVDIANRLVQPDHERFVPPDADPKKPTGPLYILPGNEETHAIPTMVRGTGMFIEALEDLAHVLDVVVVDTSPIPGALLTYVFEAATHVLIPAKMELLGLDGLISTMKTLGKWPQAKLIGIVPNMHRARTDLHKHNLAALKAAAADHGWPVLSPIAERIIWAEASQEKRMVYLLPGKTGKARTEAVKLAATVNRAIGGE